jgi:iron-sulfur cluster protein
VFAARLSFSKSFPFVARRGPYFCNEPWVGVLAVEVNQDVTFCQCYLKMRLGNLHEQSLDELWNAPQLVELRRDFKQGVLPRACQGQVCPPAVGADSYLSRIPTVAEIDPATAEPPPRGQVLRSHSDEPVAPAKRTA